MPEKYMSPADIKKLPYPENLLRVVLRELPEFIAPDIEETLEDVFKSINEREALVLQEYYKNKRSLVDIGEIIQRSNTLARHILQKGEWRIRRSYADKLRIGLKAYNEKQEATIDARNRETRKSKDDLIKALLKDSSNPNLKAMIAHVEKYGDVGVTHIGLSKRARESLKYREIGTLLDLCALTPEEALNLPNCGYVTMFEIQKCLLANNMFLKNSGVERTKDNILLKCDNHIVSIPIIITGLTAFCDEAEGRLNAIIKAHNIGYSDSLFLRELLTAWEEQYT